MGSPNSALQLQQFFASDRAEAEIFPSKARLPEGISQATFEQKYRSVDSTDYQQMVSDIDKRLDALPLYQIAVLP